MASTDHGTIGLRGSLTNIIAYAYDSRWATLNRILMPAGAPQGEYDFLDTLPNGGKEALRNLLKEQYGLVAQRQTRLTDVVLRTLLMASARFP